MSSPLYLDYAATTPVRTEALKAMRDAEAKAFGNASSIHRYGREAKGVLEEGRAAIARTLGAQPAEIVFTSGGTESANAMIAGLLAGADPARRTILTALTEHPCVIESCEAITHRGYRVAYVTTDMFARTAPEALAEAITDDTALVALMHVNNELGTVNNIASLAAAAHARGALFACDAVQSYGKFPFTVAELGVDALAIASHKIYGPKGIGALYIKRGAAFEGFIRGGAQERNRRGGTEAVPLVAGFAAAAVAAAKEMREVLVRTARLKTAFVRALIDAIPGIEFAMHPQDAIPHLVNVTFANADALEPEAIVPGLDLRGIAASNGAACTSGALQPSHVHLAVGRSRPQAACAVRFSIGRETTEEELLRAVAALKECVGGGKKAPHKA